MMVDVFMRKSGPLPGAHRAEEGVRKALVVECQSTDRFNGIYKDLFIISKAGRPSAVALLIDLGGRFHLFWDRYEIKDQRLDHVSRQKVASIWRAFRERHFTRLDQVRNHLLDRHFPPNGRLASLNSFYAADDTISVCIASQGTHSKTPY